VAILGSTQPAIFAITRISPGNFATASATRRACKQRPDQFIGHKVTFAKAIDATRNSISDTILLAFGSVALSGPRHAAHPGLVRPPVDPAHDALHAAEFSAVQRLLEMMTGGPLQNFALLRFQNRLVARPALDWSIFGVVDLSMPVGGRVRRRPYQSPSRWRFTTRIRLRIMKRPAFFSAIAT
jgi:hypothetical protein